METESLCDKLTRVDDYSKYPWYEETRTRYRDKIEATLNSELPKENRSALAFNLARMYIMELELKKFESSRSESIDVTKGMLPMGYVHQDQVATIALVYSPLNIWKISVSQFDVKTAASEYAKTACTFISLGFFMDMARVLTFVCKLSKDAISNSVMLREYFRMIDKEFWSEGMDNSIEFYKEWVKKTAGVMLLCEPQEALAIMNERPWKTMPFGMMASVQPGTNNVHDVEGVHDRWIDTRESDIVDILIELRTIAIRETHETGKFTLTAFLFVAGASTMSVVFIPCTDSNMWWIFDSHGSFVKDCSVAISFDMASNIAKFIKDCIAEKLVYNPRIADMMLRCPIDTSEVYDDEMIEQFRRWVKPHLLQSIRPKA